MKNSPLACTMLGVGAALLLGIAPILLASPQDEKETRTQGGKLPLAKDLVDNVDVRLAAACISQARGQNLEAKFSVPAAEGRPAQEFAVEFPAHSHTTHERTLITIIRASVSWEGKDVHEWRDTTLRVTFSVPAELVKSGRHLFLDYSSWFLKSLEVPKKE